MAIDREKRRHTRQLTLAGMDLAVARGRLKESMRRVKNEVKTSRDAGVSITEIARRVGVTRQTVYDILDEKYDE